VEFEKVTDPSVFEEDEYLTPEQLLELQNILVDRAVAILEGSRDEVSRFTSERESHPDEMDQASSESERDFSIRLAQRDRKLIDKVRHALETIDEGEYGACEACGGPIGYRRQLVRPVARLCIDCKTEAETVERIRAMG
jgi:DnaK suppressor protein